MYKSKLSNCNACPQLKNKLVVGETNCEDDLSKVRILILAEAPALNEVNQNRPLVGRSGNIFRQAFNMSKLDTLPYYISNVVLCSNLVNGKTYTPSSEAIELCKPNWQKLIEVTDPELILIMGTIPMKVFGIADKGITKLRGKFYNYNGRNVLVTVHPSYILQNGGLKSEAGNTYVNDFNLAYSTLIGKNNKSNSEPIIEPYSFKLPDECYSEDISLFDVQLDRDNNKVVYIFNKTDGTQYYHSEDTRMNYFYVRDGDNADTPSIVSCDNVNLVKDKKYSPDNMATFESDVKLVQKHSIDYRYMRNKLKIPEPKVPLSIMYMDIEVFSEGSRSFPRPDKAERPINSISFVNGCGNVNVYLLKLPEMDSSEINPIDGVTCKIFNSEVELLEAFCGNIKQYQPNVITGWNSNGFDFPYIFQRMINLKMDINKLSPCNIAKFDTKGDWPVMYLIGTFLLDQLELFKKYTPNKKESYKLSFIAQDVIGKDKVAYEGTLDELYTNNINKFIEYSAVDTDLLREIEEKTKHIELVDEMIRICSTTWSSYLSTNGFIDPLFISYAKNNNLVCRDRLKGTKVKFKGGFVKTPKSGLHKWVVDLDYTSLYPSIIMSCNIDLITYIGKIDSSIAEKYIYNKDKLPEEFKLRLYPAKLRNYKDITVTPDKFDEFIKTNEGIVTINGAIYCGHDKKMSFLGKIVSYLWESRTNYKKERKKYKSDSDEYIIADIKQSAFKILMNSLYGSLGNEYFRLFNIDLAESITQTGAEISRFAQYHTGWYLKNGHDKIDPDFETKYNNEEIPYIIYGDTDSLFIALGEYLADKGEI